MSWEIEHAVKNYGAVVYGGEPSDRTQALRRVLKSPTVSIDGRVIDQCPAGLRRVMESYASLLVMEFDSLPAAERTSLAQRVKGLAERRDLDVQIGFTAADGASVVEAEPDLRARIRSFDVAEVEHVQ